MTARAPSSSSTPATLWRDEVVRAIEDGEVGLVTSDVFDTLVWRPVSRPHHVFARFGDRLRSEGVLRPDLDGRRFAMGRIRAEHEARVANRIALDTLECTLQEAWDLLPTDWFADGAGPDDGVAGELRCEAAVLRPHLGNIAVLDLARDRGIPAVLVSDTYLTSEQLRQLLLEVGLRLDEVDVETSASRRLGKSEGLLADVIASHPHDGRAIHLGDHPIADVRAAHDAGAEPCHVDVDTDDNSVAIAHRPWSRLSEAAGTDGGRSATIRSTLVDAGPLGHDPSYQFGVAVAGPIMAGFAGWAGRRAEELGAAALHCMLREGARIAELVDIVRPESPERHLLHASRWGVMRAAVVDGTPVELERALARRGELTAEHVADAFGVPADAVASVFGGPTVPRLEQRDAYRALAGDAALMESIVAESARLRRGAQRYLDRELRIDDGPIVLCDIGWGGTIQEGLTAILRDAGVTNDVVGLYALLSPPSDSRIGRGALMHGFLPRTGPAGASIPSADIAIRHPEFLERVNTPQIGTLLEYADDGTPVTRPDDHDEMSPSLGRAQLGVLDFAEHLSSMALVDEERRHEWFDDEPFAAAALESLAAIVQSPDPRLAIELGSWQHDDVAGDGAEALSNDTFERWITFANAVDAADLSMHDIYWFAGVAARSNSALADQFAALAGGRDPDSVCPPSPAGIARIAAFEPGSELATGLVETVPHTGVDGWMLLQLDSAVRGLRSLRIDFGGTDLLADIGDIEIVLKRDGAAETIVNGVSDLRLRFVDGVGLGGSKLAFRAGGHALVDLPDGTVDDVTGVSMSLGFRVWPLTDSEVDTLVPRWRLEASRLRGRARSAVGRIRGFTRR